MQVLLILFIATYAHAKSHTLLTYQVPVPDNKYANCSTINQKKAEVKENDVKIYFKSQENPHNDISIYPSHLRRLVSIGFCPEKETLILIHGWNGSYMSDVNIILLDAYLSKHDINILVIDWSIWANQMYVIACACLEQIGYIVGNFINSLHTYFKIDLNQVFIVGFSLGAHVAGVAGRTAGGRANYIIGLDPGRPLFEDLYKDIRLNCTDAKFVQVIHTSNLGIAVSMGHADYYPNYPNDGVLIQPGCPPTYWDYCSHKKSHEYLGESIKSGTFLAMPCEVCGDYFKEQSWRRSPSYLGEFCIDKTAYGTYCLETNTNPPYAKC